jgi:hypothetical protein
VINRLESGKKKKTKKKKKRSRMTDLFTKAEPTGQNSSFFILIKKSKWDIYECHPPKSGRAEKCTKRDPVGRQVANVGRLGFIPQIAR